MFEPTHLAALPHRIVAKHVMRRRLDPHDISAKLKVLPLVKATQLSFLCLDLEAKTDAIVDDGYGNDAERVSRGLVLPDLLAKVRLRRWDRSIAELLRFIGVARMRGPHHFRDRGEETRAFVQQGMANVHMIEEHMRRPVKAAVDDTIRELDLVAANVSFNAPHETQIFSKDRGLPYLSFRPENAPIALPSLAIADEPRGDCAS